MIDICCLSRCAIIPLGKLDFSCLSSCAIIPLTKKRADHLPFLVFLVVQSSWSGREELDACLFLTLGEEKSWSFDFSCLSSCAIIPLGMGELVA